jgi:hypothetical protein
VDWLLFLLFRVGGGGGRGRGIVQWEAAGERSARKKEGRKGRDEQVNISKLVSHHDLPFLRNLQCVRTFTQFPRAQDLEVREGRNDEELVFAGGDEDATEGGVRGSGEEAD